MLKGIIRMFILMLCLININIVYASDITISDISVSDKKVTKEQDVEISVELDGSYKSQSIEVTYFQSSDEPKYTTTNLYYDERSKTYKGNMRIYGYSESGTWKVFSINFLDKNGGNYDMYNSYLVNTGIHETMDLSNGDILVDLHTSDNTPPNINTYSIKIDNDYITEYDYSTFSVEITDDISGVKFAQVSYYDKSTQQQRAYDLHYNEETNRFEADIIDHKDGRFIVGNTIEIDSIIAYDNNENFASVYNKEVHDYGKVNLSKGSLKVKEYDSYYEDNDEHYEDDEYDEMYEGYYYEEDYYDLSRYIDSDTLNHIAIIFLLQLWPLGWPIALIFIVIILWVTFI